MWRSDAETMIAGETDLFGKVPKQWPGNGYAATPGSGPEGMTCGDCVHAARLGYHNKKYWKCGIGHISHSDASDIRKSAPACRLFSVKE